MVTGLADPGANVIFGAVIDDAYDGEVHVTIIATGFTPSFEDNILAGKVPLLLLNPRDGSSCRDGRVLAGRCV